MSLIKRDTPRPIKFSPGISPYAHGSVMAEFGNTKVHITATVQESVPSFLKGKGQGWVTAEYAMLPSSTHTRCDRERKGPSGRTQEIQRLIGRSLRSIVDLKKLGERSILIDCDVIVADGGTRTTSISGAYIALEMAVRKLMKDGLLLQNPIKEGLAGISIGITTDDEVIADLNYEEDSSCGTDMNIVMTSGGKFIEIQGTAEGEPFSMEHLQDLLACAQKALQVVMSKQKAVLESL
jgi:ribonuclease PH